MMYWPNMLLIAGTGRNVGKTTFACKIIENISKTVPVVAIKITPHVHELCPSCQVLYKSANLSITEETSKDAPKDSSKMLAAGAQKVYYVQGADAHLQHVVEFLQERIPNDSAVVCESAALRNKVAPGLFVLMSTTPQESLKNEGLIGLAQVHILDYVYDPGQFRFENGMWIQ